MVRLYIYFVEATNQPPEAEKILKNQLGIMAHRLWYYITWPAMTLTLIFGSWMLFLVPNFLTEPWMHIKLLGVSVLVAYHFHLGRLLKQLKANTLNWSSKKLRIYK